MEKAHEDKLSRRKGRRFEPRNYVTVAFHQDNIPFTYGLISNISPSGACVVTTSPLPRDRNIFLKLSFFQRPELFETNARVLWCREGTEKMTRKQGFQGLIFHGIEFLDLSDSQKTKLADLLESAEFDTQYATMAGPPEGCAFEDLATDLREDLERLGERFRKEIGEN